MKKSTTLIAIFSTAFILSSCASNKAVESKIEQEINEVPVSATIGTSQKINDQITSSSLSAEQKKKLMELEDKAHKQNIAITEEIEKTKVIFVQTILSPKMSQTEYSVLKEKLKKLNRERLQNGFKIAEEVRKIIKPASSSTEDNEIYKAVIENRMRGI